MAEISCKAAVIALSLSCVAVFQGAAEARELRTNLPSPFSPGQYEYEVLLACSEEEEGRKQDVQSCVLDTLGAMFARTLDESVLAQNRFYDSYFCMQSKRPLLLSEHYETAMRLYEGRINALLSGSRAQFDALKSYVGDLMEGENACLREHNSSVPPHNIPRELRWLDIERGFRLNYDYS